MYQYNAHNFINEMIGLAFVEVFVYIMCLLMIHYLCRIDKKKMLWPAVGTFIKIFVWNIASQSIIFMTKTNIDRTRFWVTLINIIIGMLLIAVYKIYGKAKISEIFAVTLLEDAISIVLFIAPYLLLKNYMTDGEIYFYNSPTPVKSVLFVLMLTVYYVLALLLVKKFMMFLEKHFHFRKKATSIIVFVLYGLTLVVTFLSYYNSEAYVKGNLIILFVITVAIGLTLPYLASIYVRRRDLKQEIERKEKLLEEKENIKAAGNNELTYDDRKFRHDIDKHMNVIKEMADEGASEEEIKEYASSIKETYK